MNSLKIYLLIFLSAVLLLSCNSQAKEPFKNLTVAAYQKLTKKDKMVLVDFNAVWCGPCKALKPLVDNISNKYKSKGLTVLSIDVDSNDLISNELHIQSIPLLIIYKNGKVVWRNEGYISQDEIEKHLN